MSVSGRALVFLLSLFSACWLWPVDVRSQQQTNRCTGPAGNTIYTDRACASIGASDRLPRGTASLAYRQRRGGCARTVQELIYEITTAIDTRDVNRLGAVYHWVGLNAASGDRILDRLQTVVDRPLVDIVPLRAASAPIVTDATIEPPNIEPPITAVAPATAAATAPNPPIFAQNAVTNGVGTGGAEAPVSRPPVRRAPVGLRLQQTLGKSATPSQTTLGLRKHLDCWWITL
jgi:hypothetical protein